jgi:hypothetical protein
VPLDRQRVIWVLERRLRGSAHYWRRHSASRARMAIRASAGGAACIVFGLIGIIVAPFGLHRAVRWWCVALGGLGRVVALTGVQWKGY